MKINLLDLFSGIGGFALGLQQAGFKFKNHYFSEVDKYAVKCYQKHFPSAAGLGDIRTINDVFWFGKINIITFGFPCQDLSIAGKRAGLKGAQSGLFYEAARLIRALKPDFFIFENVKGLLTGGGGKWFEGCLREIADIGLYECSWQLLNTSWFLPQNRERIYFVGSLRKGSVGKIFPIENSGKTLDELQGQRVNTITTRTAERASTGSYIIENELYKQTKKLGRSKRIKGAEGNSAGLLSFGGGWGQKTGLYVVPRGKNNGGSKEITNCPTITKSAFEYNNFFMVNAIRRLTPTECERLQGFPDGWTKGFSDSRRYKMLGNAVSVPVVKAVAERIIKIGGFY